MVRAGKKIQGGDTVKVVIVGGVAGGATAAARLRRLDENVEIVVIERTGYVSYANCGLPYYVGGTIDDPSKLTLQTPESFKKRFDIDVRVHQEAVSVDRSAKTVTVRRLTDGVEYVETYDKLVLSPGAHASVPPLHGMDSKRLFVLRTVEDTFAIANFIEDKRPRTAVVVGAGFIGLEMAENLTDRGIEVTVLQRGGHAMPTLDGDMASIVHNELRSNGVSLVLGANVTGFEEVDGRILTSLADSDPIESDMVLLAVGVTPESALARESGLDLGLRGSIKVDSHMRTSDPDIYAVGDVIQVNHWVTGDDTLIALAGPANKQGRIAADNICGIPSEFKGSQGSSVMKLFGKTIATTGLTQHAAETSGIECDSVILSPASHATYYPGSSSIVLKVVFERPGGRILGAQAIGAEGVEKRMDVIATAIRACMTAHDLTELELCYAPPYSSAKDPVNMAGYVIENILAGLVRQVTWGDVAAAGLLDESGDGCVSAACGSEACMESSEDVPADSEPGRTEGLAANARKAASPVLLDCRTSGEFARSHIAGALHVPLDELRSRMDELPCDRDIWVHCQSGLRSYVACRILFQHGFECANVAGGYGFYEQTALDRSVRTEGVGPCGMPVA